MRNPIFFAVSSLALSMSLVVAGCKLFTNQGAGRKSIDVVSSGDPALRSGQACGPGTLANGTPEEAVIRSAAALPPFLASQFSDLSATYRLSDDPGADCAKAMSSMPQASLSAAEQAVIKDNRVAGLRACWIVPADESSKVSQPPQVVLGKGVQDIHKGLIVTSYYAFAEWYIDRVFGPAVDKLQTDSAGKAAETELGSKGEQLISVVTKFREVRKSLAEAVLSDLAAAGKNDVIARYEQDFGAAQASLPASIAFQNFIAAEFTDTWYCNVATNESLKNSAVFVKAREVYPMMAELMGKAWFVE
ncbi:MAG: hypothetical protein RIQ81_420 [Pseudomonadota bacterium]|jgi:hypothetical protein